MKNKVVFILLLIIVIVGGLFFFGKKLYPNKNQTQQKVRVVADANTVSIQNFSFSPDTLTVKQGTTVTWVNNDSVSHTVKSDTFSSSDIKPGDKFEFTFNSKGTFDYSCSIHPSMTGKIVVE